MRTSAIITASVVVSLLLAGCPGRNTPPPENPEASTPRLAGLAAFTAELLRRGAGERTAEQIAEEIEFVGGDLWVETESDYTAIQVRVLRDHLDLALGLLADLSQRPTFPAEEIEIMRRRELDRLSLMQSQPRWIASQAFFRELYGAGHPYGAYDANPQSISALTRDHLTSFHATHYVPRNAFLTVVGDVQPEAVQEAAQRHFGDWADRPAPERSIPAPRPLEARRVVVVDRPGATQAQISVGNLALDRAHPDYIRLRVANQVFGGSASARLFMNLRERCSYSYGVYSSVPTRQVTAPFIISGAVESQHTAGALREIFAEIDRLLAVPPPASELDAAQSYMVGGFPITTETAGNLANLITVQRVFGLSDDYWDTYRSSIAAVTADQAFQAARAFIHPDRVLVVIVGDAAQVAEPARRYGQVTVIDQEGGTSTLEALPDQWPGGEPDQCAETPSSEGIVREQAPPSAGTPRDMDFPDLQEATLGNGLEVLTLEHHALPLVYLDLVIRSGSAADPTL
jgi:zinc protease